MLRLDEPFDCPECGSATWPNTRILHPSIPVRFTDVVNELREISELASAAIEVEGSKVAAACRRAESLLRILRAQFLQEVVLDRAAAGESARSR